MRQNAVDKVLNVIVILYTLITLMYCIQSNLAIFNDSNSFGVTEFLINYQGGFVRRGLVGEVLLLMAKYLSISPKIIILVLSISSCILFFYILVRKFLQNHYNWWILASPFILSALYSNGIRKDYMLFLLLLCELFIYLKVTSNGLKCLLMTIIAVLAMNVHEAFVFWGIPFVLQLIIKDENLQIHKFYRYSLAIFILLSFCFISYFKGNVDVANVISESWLPYMPSDFINPQPWLSSIGAIGWTTDFAFQNHIDINFSRSRGIYSLVLRPIVLIFILYFATNILFINKIKDEDIVLKRRTLLMLLVFHFISLVPMFTLLSCDGGRVLQYWLLASFSVFLFIPIQIINNVFPRWYKYRIGKLDLFFIKYLTPHKTTLYLLLLFGSYTDIGFHITYAIDRSILLTDCRFLSSIIHGFIQLLF